MDHLFAFPVIAWFYGHTHNSITKLLYYSDHKPGVLLNNTDAPAGSLLLKLTSEETIPCQFSKEKAQVQGWHVTDSETSPFLVGDMVLAANCRGYIGKTDPNFSQNRIFTVLQV